MLCHPSDRFYVMKKIIFTLLDYNRISPITFEMDCSYLNIQLDRTIHAVKYIPNMKKLCPMNIFIKRKLIIITKQYIIF